MSDHKYWLCPACGWHGEESAMLVGVNPFDPEDIITGCPQCKAVETLLAACDEPGCTREVACGWPTKDGGYRRTCHEHWKAATHEHRNPTRPHRLQDQP